QGLVPPLEQLVDLHSSDFEVVSIEDEGALVSKFDPDSGESAIISERTWMIHYAGRTDLTALPTTFRFPEPRVDVKEISYLRYDDADLAQVEPIVTLQHSYGQVRRVWLWYLLTGAFLLAIAAVALL